MKRAYFKSVKKAFDFYKASRRLSGRISIQSLSGKCGWVVRWY